MAKERKIPDFSPDDQEKIKQIEAGVLNKRPPDQQAPKPKQMLPNFYSKGGMVKLGSPKVSAPCSDSKTLSCK
jgi:hypothetical protein